MLLIDEVDRSDEEFEAFLLEVLSDFQVTIPEIGTIQAVQPPVVVLTSNRTREVHDALKRRCLYHWIDYPTFATEVAIVRSKVPGRRRRAGAPGGGASSRSCAAPSCTRCPAWPRRSTGPRRSSPSTPKALDPAVVDDTLGVLLKYQDDVARMKGANAEAIVDRVRAAG